MFFGIKICPDRYDRHLVFIDRCLLFPKKKRGPWLVNDCGLFYSTSWVLEIYCDLVFIGDAILSSKGIQQEFWKTVWRPIGIVFHTGSWPLSRLRNAVIVMLLAFVVLLSSGLNYLYTLILGLAGNVGSMLIVPFVNLTGGKLLPAYVYSRFSSFLNPFADEYNTGHQMVNGYYAMFNGGLFGRGLEIVSKTWLLKRSAHRLYFRSLWKN